MISDPLRHFRKEVRRLQAYEVETPSGLVKLDANENPYPPPPSLMEALAEKSRSIELNRYPDPAAGSLRTLLSERTGWDREGILLGNGSDELIGILLTACGGDGAGLLVPAPTFAMYRIIGIASGWEVKEHPLSPLFDLEVDSFLDTVRAFRPRLTVIAYPNNPSGNCFDEKALLALLEEATGLVVIDEAYFDFSGRTFLDRLRDFRNLVILRTLSKIGLAALRLGFLMADPAVVKELNKVRLPYNVSTFSQIAASLVLGNPAFLEEEIRTIVRERASLMRAMKAMEGIEAFASDSNFILFRTARDSSSVFASLKKEGVLVRDLGRPGPLRNCLRVTVGTPEENRVFLKALVAAAR